MDPKVCICSVTFWAKFEELQLFLKVRNCSLYLVENFYLVDLCKLCYNLDRLICILQWPKIFFDYWFLDLRFVG